MFRGYVYNKKTTYQNGNVAWRCSDMSKFKCLASCIVNGTKLIRSRLNHNHSTRKSAAGKQTMVFLDNDFENLLSDVNDTKK